MREGERERERAYSVIIVYCYDCSLLLLVILNLLPCLIYKLSFTIGVYYGEKHSICMAQDQPQFQEPLGSVMYPPWMEGHYHTHVPRHSFGALAGRRVWAVWATYHILDLCIPALEIRCDLFFSVPSLTFFPCPRGMTLF